MFLFPVVYILSFVYAIRLLLKKEIKGFLVFIIFGLPIYINALSVAFMYGFGGAIPLMQAFKEISLFLALGMVLLNLKKKPKLHLVDKLIIVFFIYTLLYLLLPIGSYNFSNRLLGFKALSVFPLIYFTGRFCKVESINLNHIFSYICIVSIIAAIVLLFEVIFYQHLHTHTGFMDFNIHYYNGEISGNNGLIWTFETESGLKRFGSIFSSPLELSTASILALSVLLALATNRKNKINFTNFYVLSFFATLFCVIFAVSRASFVNYFILIYCFAYFTNNKKIIVYFHYLVIAILVYFTFSILFLKGDMLDFIIATLNFQSTSSIGHVVEWVNGINAILMHPLGMGLGSSGRISMSTGDNIGGENQLVIIGVQVGVAMIAVYILIYTLLLKTGIKVLKTATGKKKKIILAVVLLKIGIIIPMITSYIDTFIYLTYISYFLSGMMMNMIMTNSIKQLNQPLNKELQNISTV